MSTTYMTHAAWQPQHPQMHPIGTYQDQQAMDSWQMSSSLAPYPHIQQATHLPQMQYLPPGAQPPLRPQSSQSSLQSALHSPIHPNHAQAMAHAHAQQQQQQQQQQQPLHQISLPPINQNPLSMSQPSPQQQAPRYSQPVPHQVVGQQGIRGVLPKSTGDRSSPDEACEPEQEVDGSWPCKFCGKKYRHAKHLRRHHARHTGETPYECQLCARRFGRSDVLKRHYHKCATRRGVEVGDHLAGQRGHPRRRTRGPGGDMGQDLGSPISNGPPDVKPPITPVSMSIEGMNPAWAA